MSRNTLPQIYSIYQERSAEWRQFAACRGMGPALFFCGRGESAAEAKEVCRGCDVKAECCDYSLATNQQFGIFAGMGERERRREAQRRRLRQRQGAA